MSLHINRRAFLTVVTGALAAPAVVFGIRPARAATTLTLGHGAAPGNPRTVAAAKFAELVAEKTAGRVRINVAGAETLGSDSAMLTSLRTGALDFTANSQGATSALVPELAALGLPFLFPDTKKAMEVLNGPVGADLNKRFEAVGVVPLDWWDNGIRHLTNSKRKISAPAELKGLKVRTPADPMTIDIFQALGAATEQIAFGELYIALQQGVVDGQENPLANIESSKLFEVNKYVSLTAHKWESTPFLMSKIAQARLGADLEAVRAAANEAGDLQRKLSAEKDAQVLANFKSSAAVEVTEVEHEAFVKATVSVAENWKKKPFGDFVSKIEAEARA
ncbi:MULTISPECIES: TRAP transporter substrate-binding protein [Agrobacterium]|uniref:TRAP transporter substrate-binding protein n=1 Tax=Agrobacterium tumefaciens TaxID=358 RepID=A0AAE6BHT3_AGRTU|nr:MULTISPECIES: TRAP transporter substrate-binding protein [Agrobacterium]QCL77332.1 TRAP transporter substrate-binding protein [Agrobacterium tumefaciens]QCL82839.1 TRAP transporter substrate-binding protein [Agrobacterium tumefaciens]WCK05830.1 TRAP transporter substrate-binding protein [Agrobacterium tumefaciens]CUX71813.1 Tripartite ATP-independent periplasmic transporter solute receptor, DctP family [Agrobacterium sp. NCPPB 925]